MQRQGLHRGVPDGVGGYCDGGRGEDGFFFWVGGCWVGFGDVNVRGGNGSVEYYEEGVWDG